VVASEPAPPSGFEPGVADEESPQALAQAIARTSGTSGTSEDRR
jgi:hypothetical protein